MDIAKATEPKTGSARKSECTCETYTDDSTRRAHRLEIKLKSLDKTYNKKRPNEENRDKFELAIEWINNYADAFPNCLQHGKIESKARPSFMLRQKLRADARMFIDLRLHEKKGQRRSWGLDTYSAPLIASRLLRIGGAPLIASQLLHFGGAPLMASRRLLRIGGGKLAEPLFTHKAKDKGIAPKAAPVLGEE
mmetsp:Transcript_2020/g.4723  ORF Transcript_2020/g.4723 Transcript_2020/m.4723 type:complete len:193 (+) Transcript_2020:285-863(+)